MAKGTVNKVTLIGRLGQDPEIRFTGEGNAVASFSVATNESWKSKDGNIQERTEWTKVTVFGATAEKYVQPYVKKGTLVYVEGSLKTDKWQDKDGNDKYSTGVVANNYGGIQILGGGESSTDSSPSMNQERPQKENLNQTVEDDDLPFQINEKISSKKQAISIYFKLCFCFVMFFINKIFCWRDKQSAERGAIHSCPKPYR